MMELPTIRGSLRGSVYKTLRAKLGGPIAFRCSESSATLILRILDSPNDPALDGLVGLLGRRQIFHWRLLGCWLSPLGVSVFFGSGVLPMSRTSFVLCPVGVAHSYVVRGTAVPAPVSAMAASAGPPGRLRG